MRRLLCLAACILPLLALGMAANAYLVQCDFDIEWTGDYVPGWENSDYRYGEAPSGKMMEYVMGGRAGTGGMRLIAASAPRPTDFWAIVNVTDDQVNAAAMQKAYDPWISVWLYDRGWESGNLHQAGQLYAVPSWVNMYIDDDKDGVADSDWTDTQFGARFNQAPPNDNYYYVAAGEGMPVPGWQDTGVDRVSDNWVQLKMQLSSMDGRIHYYLRFDEADPFAEVGQSYRNDYVDLTTPALATMYNAPLSAWLQNKPSTIWDDFAYGSSYAPEPSSMLVLLTALTGAVAIRRRKK